MGELRVRLGHDGRLAAAAADNAPRLLKEPGDYRVFPGPNQSYLLSKHTDDARARGRVLMMGELVNRMTVVEIINLVTSTSWNGELHVAGPEGTRVLTIAQGALKHARTEIGRERIGELLVRAGLLEREQLEQLLPKKPADQRFGQMLTQRGLLDEEQLFKQLQSQSETIFYAAMLVESGLYWFVAPPENAPAPPTTFHLSIQGLLMEGVQRIDEMALYRERIPHNRFFPAAKENAKRDKLEPAMLSVLDLSNGARSIDDLIRATGIGEFLAVKAVYNLIRGGQVALRRGPTLDSAATKRLVRQYNDIVRDIFVVVATYGSMERTSRALSSWLSGSAHAKVLGEEVDIDGTLDFALVTARVETLSSDDPMQDLHRALHETAAYALFIASNGIPRNEERTLSRDVNHRLTQLKL
ncbi:MAG TPA: DUF4388 domain-containing protein [Polyangiales bacterium]|nr:DUF4388 domain-containing protein [Polyangiales bacterium]